MGLAAPPGLGGAIARKSFLLLDQSGALCDHTPSPSSAPEQSQAFVCPPQSPLLPPPLRSSVSPVPLGVQFVIPLARYPAFVFSFFSSFVSNL